MAHGRFRSFLPGRGGGGGGAGVLGSMAQGSKIDCKP